MIGANFLYVVVAFILFGRKITELKPPDTKLQESLYAQ
jgi:hypothetical protein